LRRPIPACAINSRVNALIETAPDSYSDVLAGALAGAFAAALTTPLDVLVTHTLTSGERGLQQAAKSAQQLILEQGLGTLMRGVGLRTLYYAPSVGCFFGLYEYFRRTLEGGL